MQICKALIEISVFEGYTLGKRIAGISYLSIRPQQNKVIFIFLIYFGQLSKFGF